MSLHKMLFRLTLEEREEKMATNGKVKLNDRHIKELIEKGKKQNSKLCFDDITTLIGTLEDFSPNDYEKIMEAINEAGKGNIWYC